MTEWKLVFYSLQKRKKRADVNYSGRIWAQSLCFFPVLKDGKALLWRNTRCLHLFFPFFNCTHPTACRYSCIFSFVFPIFTPFALHLRPDATPAEEPHDPTTPSRRGRGGAEASGSPELPGPDWNSNRQMRRMKCERQPRRSFHVLLITFHVVIICGIQKKNNRVWEITLAN